MADQTTNPDAEAAALVTAKAKTPPAPPPLPSGSILGDAAPAAKPAAAVNPNLQPGITAAIATIQTAIKQIDATGAVTSDLRLAVSSCTAAITWLNKAAAAIPAA